MRIKPLTQSESKLLASEVKKAARSLAKPVAGLALMTGCAATALVGEGVMIHSALTRDVAKEAATVVKKGMSPSEKRELGGLCALIGGFGGALGIMRRKPKIKAKGLSVRA